MEMYRFKLAEPGAALRAYRCPGQVLFLFLLADDDRARANGFGIRENFPQVIYIRRCKIVFTPDQERMRLPGIERMSVPG